MTKGRDDLTDLYAAVFGAMKAGGPDPLMKRVASEADLRDRPELAGEDSLIPRLRAQDGADRLLGRIRQELGAWDAGVHVAWADGTEPKTEARRTRIYDQLKLGGELRELFDKSFPLAESRTVVVSREFESWYAESLEQRDPFYWQHYADYLHEKRGWHSDSVSSLDLSAARIVERLANPERENAYQAKGLVVGYVQSGKTANFTGVTAKAIDAGYRLVIVLTGTTDLLRAQTQRRLDKELVGQENLLRGVNLDDEESLLSVDYHSDPDWDGFVSHGDRPAKLSQPDILRLTTYSGDYKALLQGITALDFDLFDPSLPLHDKVNLHRVPARLAVVKKNKAVLTKLVKDLKKITAKLGEIPALIIDDESDQASVNTSNPKDWAAGRKERTAINRLVSELISLLPRGQYIGYTATPFANVFVDPADAVDVFPRDFILALERPPGYMGASDFHDLEPLEDDATVAESNEKAYVRAVHDDSKHSALRKAIDMYVLTGAVKLFREAAESKAAPFTHHTMLVHESVRTADHAALAEAMRELWKTSAFYGPAGRRRLENLFTDDLLPVMLVRADNELVPEEFKSVQPYIAEVVSRIEGPAADPVAVVNSDKEAASEEIDFQSHGVWKILVGGAKLSRGFTVEGLTVSYYRRTTKQQDTLMQMGRWFGFRRGFRDLVRLYIGQDESGTKQNTYDLYKAFEAACRSEELFREELGKYAAMVDGKPQITPAQIQPLVAQHLGWLNPAAANKMYNAKLVERRSPGERLEPTGYPANASALKANATAIQPLIEMTTNEVAFSSSSDSASPTYPAWVGTLSHEPLVEILAKLRWDPDEHFEADLNWLADLSSEQIEDWAILLPQHSGAGPRSTILGRENLSVIRRTRRRDPLFGGISVPRHRHAADRIAGVKTFDGDKSAQDYAQPKRGAFLLYPMVEGDDTTEVPSELDAGEFIAALALVAPLSTGSPDGTRIRFVARDSTRKDDPIVELDESAV